MDGLEWNTLLKWMIWGYHYFRKHPSVSMILRFTVDSWESLEATCWQLDLNILLVMMSCSCLASNWSPGEPTTIHQNTSESNMVVSCLQTPEKDIDMGVSKNTGTPKSSILIGFSIFRPSILGYPYFWKHPYWYLNFEMWFKKLQT